MLRDCRIALGLVGEKVLMLCRVFERGLTAFLLRVLVVSFLGVKKAWDLVGVRIDSLFIMDFFAEILVPILIVLVFEVWVCREDA